ncbi:MAG: hypothetical protein UW20_C0023G0011, partial [Candidatus Woesebacteria bacterium GW2011_GWB1_44_11]
NTSLTIALNKEKANSKMNGIAIKNNSQCDVRIAQPPFL